MEGDKLNFKILLAKALKYWYLFVIIFLLAMISAYYYLQFTPYIYQATATILIKDSEKSSQLDEEAVFAELGLAKNNKNLENERLILKSTPLMQAVVRNLGLQYQFESISQFGRREMYNSGSLSIVNWKPTDLSSRLFAVLNINDSGGYELELEEDMYEGFNFAQTTYEGEFGKSLKLPMGDLTIARRVSGNNNRSVALEILPVHVKAKRLARILEIAIPVEESSALYLSIEDQSGNRAKDILTELIKVYNSLSIEDKNQVFENTIELINERIDMISQELAETERSVEVFKTSNNMVDMSAEASIIMTDVADANKEISNVDVQLEIMQSIQDFLVGNQNNFEFVPTNSTLNNLTLANQLATFNELLSTRETQRNRLGPSHKDLLLTEAQIKNFRQTIIDNIRSITSDLQITRNAVEERRSSLTGRLQSLPRRERELIEIEREKSIKENLYLYLLQKREESYIQLSVTVPNGKVVEPSVVLADPVSPKPIQIWLVAAFLGLTLPIGLTLLLESLNDKVNTEEDIQQYTSVPINGVIGVSRKKDPIVVHESRKTVIAEMFRLLRANMAYVAPGIDLNTLLVTSSRSGEGKSFISLNLGISQALAGKKVVLIDLDLRKPTQEKSVAESLQQKQSGESRGVVDYLVNREFIEKQIIQKTDIHPNLISSPVARFRPTPVS